jgi:triosephosphate isomerase
MINIAHVTSNSTKRTKQSNSSSSSASVSTVVAASAAAAVGAIAGTYFYKQRNNDNKMEGIKTQVEGLTKQVKGALQLGRPAGSTKGSPPKEGERKYLIGGNWKCNGTVASLTELIDTFNKAGPIPANAEVAICAPFIHIPLCLSKLREDIAVGAQNCGVNDKEGAYTGEICASQLKDIGCVWVVIGHSERREGFGMAGEDSELVAKKVKVALDAGLKVMFAIGEKKEERENGTTNDVCASQLAPAAKLLEEKDWENVAIAYEPVWAIGTGLTATPEMAQETHAFIRKWMSENVGEAVANAIRIQYGGSMKGANAKDLLAQPDIDGGLIGGASLKADFFNVINGVSQDE